MAGDLDRGGHGLGAAASDFELGAGDLFGVRLKNGKKWEGRGELT